MATSWFPDGASSRSYETYHPTSHQRHLQTRAGIDIQPTHQDVADEYSAIPQGQIQSRRYCGSYPDELPWTSDYAIHARGEPSSSMNEHSRPRGSLSSSTYQSSVAPSNSQEDIMSSQSSTIDRPHDPNPNPYDSIPSLHPLASSCPSINFDSQSDVIDTTSLHPSDNRRRPRAQSSSSSSQAQRRGRHSAKTAGLQCDSCSRILKNTSEAQKHRLQHSKPFMCDDMNCRRHWEGFATKNDLERHRKTVHSRVPLLGERGGYVCVACPSSTKFWPRKDNFRAHCKRRHTDANPDDLLERSKKDQTSSPLSDNTSFVTTAPSLTDTTDDRSRQAEVGGDSNLKQTGSDPQICFEVLHLSHEDEHLAGVGAGQESGLHLSHINAPSIEVRMCDDIPDLSTINVGNGGLLEFAPVDMATYGSPGNYSEAFWDPFYGEAREEYGLNGPF